MPSRPKRTCAQPGCGALVDGGRCPAHEAKRTNRQAKDPEQVRFYGSAYWKRLRAIIRRRDPVCVMCQRRPSQTVDHIDGNWRNNDPGNLRGLCRPCEASHTGRQHRRKGGRS